MKREERGESCLCRLTEAFHVDRCHLPGRGVASQTPREHHCDGKIKASTAPPVENRAHIIPSLLLFIPFFFSNTLLNSAKTSSPHQVTVFVSGPVPRRRFKENANDLCVLKGSKASPDTGRSVVRERTHESPRKMGIGLGNHNCAPSDHSQPVCFICLCWRLTHWDSFSAFSKSLEEEAFFLSRHYSCTQCGGGSRDAFWIDSCCPVYMSLDQITYMLSS